MTRVFESARRSLPRGSSLPDDAWRQRHAGIVALLWVHAAVIPVYAVIRDFSLLHALQEGAILPVTALVASYPPFARRVRTGAASLGLLSASAILVHLSGGLIEMHFHFFVMVAVVALYQDWLPFLAAIAYVLLHHGVLGVVDPTSVFNHPAAQRDPWRWAGIHAFFIGGISAACLVTWRLNETVLDRQRQAEERLREESHVVETLNFVGRSLAAELDLHTVVQRVTDAATELSAAAFGAFFYNAQDESGESYLLYTISGVPAEAFSQFPMPRNTAVFGPTFAGESVIRLDDVTKDTRYGLSAPYHGMPPGHLPVRSYMAVPVHARSGEVLGGLFFGHPEPARFDKVDERIVVGIAAHAAIALDNARLYESERLAREAAEVARRRLALLAEASRVLASSLDVDRTLADLTRLVSPEIADSCVVYLIAADGWIEQALAHAGADMAIDIAPLQPPPLDPSHPSHPVARVIRTGKSELLEHVAPELVDGAIEDADQRDLVHRLAPASAIVVPLIGPSNTLGALALGTTRSSGRLLTQSDLEMAEELARRAGVALAHARLFADQRDVAETLQHSLLPDELPVVPGLATAARYVPGGRGAEVGGDWYDVLAFPDGTLGLVMGDVVGRGVPAASLMGQIRNALRAYAFDGYSPAESLARLNALVNGMGGAPCMATVVFAVFDPETSTMSLSNAGHPPPLLRAADGASAFIEGGLGPPLGAIADPEFRELTVPIDDGSTLVMYTDGLVEDRDTPLDHGLSRIRDVLEHAPHELEALCDHVMGGTMVGREAGDDAALLAMRCVALGSELHLELPSRPTILRPLRTAMRRWLTTAGASEQETFEILVAAGEACANAIQHAGTGSTTFEVDGHLDGEVRIAVRDHGVWRDARPTLGGRGLPIMAQFMDDVDFRKTDTGTEVILRRALSPGGADRRQP